MSTPLSCSPDATAITSMHTPGAARDPVVSASASASPVSSPSPSPPPRRDTLCPNDADLGRAASSAAPDDEGKREKAPAGQTPQPPPQPGSALGSAPVSGAVSRPLCDVVAVGHSAEAPYVDDDGADAFCVSVSLLSSPRWDGFSATAPNSSGPLHGRLPYYFSHSHSHSHSQGGTRAGNTSGGSLLTPTVRAGSTTNPSTLRRSTTGGPAHLALEGLQNSGMATLGTARGTLSRASLGASGSAGTGVYVLSPLSTPATSPRPFFFSPVSRQGPGTLNEKPEESSASLSLPGEAPAPAPAPAPAHLDTDPDSREPQSIRPLARGAASRRAALLEHRDYSPGTSLSLATTPSTNAHTTTPPVTCTASSCTPSTSQRCCSNSSSSIEAVDAETSCSDSFAGTISGLAHTKGGPSQTPLDSLPSPLRPAGGLQTPPPAPRELDSAETSIAMERAGDVPQPLSSAKRRPPQLSTVLRPSPAPGTGRREGAGAEAEAEDSLLFLSPLSVSTVQVGGSTAGATHRRKDDVHMAATGPPAPPVPIRRRPPMFPSQLRLQPTPAAPQSPLRTTFTPPVGSPASASRSPHKHHRHKKGRHCCHRHRHRRCHSAAEERHTTAATDEESSAPSPAFQPSSARGQEGVEATAPTRKRQRPAIRKRGGEDLPQRTPRASRGKLKAGGPRPRPRSGSAPTLSSSGTERRGRAHGMAEAAMQGAGDWSAEPKTARPNVSPAAPPLWRTSTSGGGGSSGTPRSLLHTVQSLVASSNSRGSSTPSSTLSCTSSPALAQQAASHSPCLSETTGSGGPWRCVPDPPPLQLQAPTAAALAFSRQLEALDRRPDPERVEPPAADAEGEDWESSEIELESGRGLSAMCSRQSVSVGSSGVGSVSSPRWNIDSAPPSSSSPALALAHPPQPLGSGEGTAEEQRRAAFILSAMAQAEAAHHAEATSPDPTSEGPLGLTAGAADWMSCSTSSTSSSSVSHSCSCSCTSTRTSTSSSATGSRSTWTSSSSASRPRRRRTTHGVAADVERLEAKFAELRLINKLLLQPADATTSVAEPRRRGSEAAREWVELVQQRPPRPATESAAPALGLGSVRSTGGVQSATAQSAAAWRCSSIPIPPLELHAVHSASNPGAPQPTAIGESPAGTSAEVADDEGEFDVVGWHGAPAPPHAAAAAPGDRYVTHTRDGSTLTFSSSSQYLYGTSPTSLSGVAFGGGLADFRSASAASVAQETLWAKQRERAGDAAARPHAPVRSSGEANQLATYPSPPLSTKALLEQERSQSTAADPTPAASQLLLPTPAASQLLLPTPAASQLLLPTPPGKQESRSREEPEPEGWGTAAPAPARRGEEASAVPAATAPPPQGSRGAVSPPRRSTATSPHSRAAAPALPAHTEPTRSPSRPVGVPGAEWASGTPSPSPSHSRSSTATGSGWLARSLVSLDRPSPELPTCAPRPRHSRQRMAAESSAFRRTVTAPSTTTASTRYATPAGQHVEGASVQRQRAGGPAGDVVVVDVPAASASSPSHPRRRTTISVTAAGTTTTTTTTINPQGALRRSTGGRGALAATPQRDGTAPMLMVRLKGGCRLPPPGPASSSSTASPSSSDAGGLLHRRSLSQSLPRLGCSPLHPPTTGVPGAAVCLGAANPSRRSLAESAVTWRGRGRGGAVRDARRHGGAGVGGPSPQVSVRRRRADRALDDHATRPATPPAVEAMGVSLSSLPFRAVDAARNRTGPGRGAGTRSTAGKRRTVMTPREVARQRLYKRQRAGQRSTTIRRAPSAEKGPTSTNGPYAS